MQKYVIAALLGFAIDLHTQQKFSWSKIDVTNLTKVNLSYSNIH